MPGNLGETDKDHLGQTEQLKIKMAEFSIQVKMDSNRKDPEWMHKSLTLNGRNGKVSWHTF
jgi:hypothetical protein